MYSVEPRLKFKCKWRFCFYFARTFAEDDLRGETQRIHKGLCSSHHHRFMEGGDEEQGPKWW